MKKLVLIMVITLSVIFSQTVQSQTIHCKPFADNNYNASIKFIHPFFAKGSEETGKSIFSGNYDLNVSIPVSEDVKLYAGLPVFNYSYTSEKYTYSSTYPYYSIQKQEKNSSNIGNLSLGVDIIDKRAATTISFGMTLPTVSLENENSFGLIYGIFTETTELHKYYPDCLTLSANFSENWFPKEGVVFGYEVGPNLLIPTKSQKSNASLMLRYNLSGGFTGAGVMLRAEFNGIFSFSDQSLSIGERTLNQLTLGIGINTPSVKPQIFYQLPLSSDISKIITGMAGIKVDISL